MAVIGWKEEFEVGTVGAPILTGVGPVEGISTCGEVEDPCEDPGAWELLESESDFCERDIAGFGILDFQEGLL